MVIPVLHDDVHLAKLLRWLDAHQLRGIIVDGADDEKTRQLVAAPHVYLSSAPGRGLQIARGIGAAATPWVWVLHADGLPSSAALAQLDSVIQADNPRWGRFNVNINGLALIAWMMNVRSRVTKICTGDQAMFFHQSLLAQIGGFPEQPLMEDIEVSKRLKHIARGAFFAAAGQVETSARRWRRGGVLATVISMWLFRCRYFFGAKPEALARDYYRGN